MSARISIVVPTRDRPEALARCLRALARQTAPGVEIVVVDDGGRLDLRLAAGAALPSAKVVRGEGRGPAAARNLGARAAAGTILCFTDDDCEPAADWAACLVAALERADVVGGRTESGAPGDPLVTASERIVRHLEEFTHLRSPGAGFVATSNLACRAELLARIPFDESYPLAAGEDRDWCARVAAAGYRIGRAPRAVVRHTPVLGGGGFLRQHLRYGRGAARFRLAGPGRALPPAFYASLLRAGFREGLVPGLLVIAAQAATVAGFLAEWVVAARPPAPYGDLTSG